MGSVFNPTIVSQEVTNLLKCGICWEYYNLPTVLPCGHTFCLKCIQEIGKHKVNNVKFVKPVVDLSIDCPNCRLKVLITDIQQMKNGVHVNYVLSSIVEAVIQIKTTNKVDASTNTDSQSCFEHRIDDIQKNLDDVFKALNKRKSVVNDARQQIDELRYKAIKRASAAEKANRRNKAGHNSANQSRNNGTTMNDTSGQQTTWASRLFLPSRLQTTNGVGGNMQNQVAELTDVDPAILSVRTTRTDTPNNSYFQMSML